jgi:hypothetical protein
VAAFKKIAFGILLLTLFAGSRIVRADSCPPGCDCTYHPITQCGDVPYYSMYCQGYPDCGEVMDCGTFYNDCATFCAENYSSPVYEDCSTDYDCAETCECWGVECRP